MTHVVGNPPTAAGVEAFPRPNRYAGKCAACGSTVAAEAGLLAKNALGKWAVLHRTEADCTTPEATTAAPEPAYAPLPDIPAGHYAVESTRSDQDLDFYRVDRPTEGKWAGRTFVKTVVGGHPDERVRDFKEVRSVLERIEAADPDKAATKYGVEIGRCYCCNRHLTDVTSRLLGIGPECRKVSKAISAIGESAHELRDKIVEVAVATSGAVWSETRPEDDYEEMPVLAEDDSELEWLLDEEEAIERRLARDKLISSALGPCPDGTYDDPDSERIGMDKWIDEEVEDEEAIERRGRFTERISDADDSDADEFLPDF